MKYFIFVIQIFLYLNSILAQNSDVISSGRPGMSIGGDVVGNKVLQVQSGVLYSSLKESEETKAWTFENVFRYGIGKNFEMNTAFNYVAQKSGNRGIDNLMLGGRYSFISEGSGLFSALAFQARIRLKGEGDFKREEFSPEFILSTLHNLNKWGSLNINLSSDGNAGDWTSMYIINWSYSLTDKLSIFLEKYATYQDKKFIDSWDTGAAYLVNKDLQIDFSFGYDLESNIKSSFYSLGFSWRNSLL